MSKSGPKRWTNRLILQFCDLILRWRKFLVQHHQMAYIVPLHRSSSGCPHSPLPHSFSVTSLNVTTMHLSELTPHCAYTSYVSWGNSLWNMASGPPMQRHMTAARAPIHYCMFTHTHTHAQHPVQLWVQIDIETKCIWFAGTYVNQHLLCV